MVKNNINSNDTTGEISVPAPEGTANLNEIVQRLEGAGIQMAEIGLKQPTLDDVFLALTGRTAEEESTRK
jgi:ABC-2 type transport system ATP-binding protein